MNLVVAVKAEPVRKARVTGPNRVTLLLTASEEAADSATLHRDASYLSKLEGTCFTCSKLNANPPQTVCEPPDPEDPPQGCIVVSDPCTCADCPPPPPPKECACIDGYPALITGLGSGYWVGLQANTFYSIVPSGGWVVAVGCESGAILGAFPVSGSNYGYGTGTILGVSVMIYPAGAVRGAGYYPANDTSFPLLALLPVDGDSIISDGSFTIINGAPGCPADNPSYFCSAENSYIYSGYPKSCLAKYPRQTSGCVSFDEFYEWPTTLPYDTSSLRPTYEPFYINMAGVEGFTGETVGSIAFQTSTNKKYCGTIQDWVQEPSDALSGLCGGVLWPDTPIGFYPDCVECSDAHVKVDCQYLLNLTNGPFEQLYGGYNSQVLSGFFGIGPALPPTTDNLNTTYSNYWQTFWQWSPLASETTDDYYYYNDHIAFIPPIGSLLNKCRCTDYTIVDTNNTNNIQYFISDIARNTPIHFIERFFCCEDRTASYPIGIDVVRPFVPAYSGCGIPCQPKCVNPRCSCEGQNVNNMAKPDLYGYVPCTECDPLGVYSISGIWWSKDLTSNIGTPVTTSSSDALNPPSERNICTNVYNSYEPQCIGPCSQIFSFNGEDWIFDPNTFEQCTGYRDPNEFLQDPCSRVFYFPWRFKDCELRYVEDSRSGIFAQHIEFVSDCGGCSAGNRLTDCICPDPNDLTTCFIKNIGGPLGAPLRENGQNCYFLSTINKCSVPRMGDIEIQTCEDLSVSTTGLTFVPIENDKCFKVSDGSLYNELDAEVIDPCACCDPQINPSGGNDPSLDYDVPTINCGSSILVNCDLECCAGSGCATGNCVPDTETVTVNNKRCGSTDGGSGGSGSGGGPL